MSWNVTAQAATKGELKADFAEKAKGAIEGGHMPQAVVDLVTASVDALPECENSTIHVETFGHFQTDQTYRGTSNMSLKVENKFAS
jgi:hypothetical protein